jgi:predicted transcriptional regulator
MTILTRQERERLVIELYNQGKTYREIAKEARISPRDIGSILNKTLQAKTEASKEQGQGNNGGEKNQNEEQEQRLSLAAQAYKLFSEGKTPLEVAIELNLTESEATKFYKEYWKLQQLHNLNVVYEEIKNDIEYFLKLYKLAMTKGMRIPQVVHALEVANNDLPSIEEQLKRLRNSVSVLQSQKRICETNLYQLNNQIATTTRHLNPLRISCERERREIESLYNEKIRLEALVTGFKNNNEEYLKLKQAAEENVKNVLTNGKLLLNFATASVIETLRRNPELCNFVLNDISNKDTDTDRSSYGSNSLSLTLPGQQQQQSFNDTYSALILEEAEKLYNKLTTELTSQRKGLHNVHT